MTLPGAINAFKSSSLLQWKSAGKLQQTLAGCITKTGMTLHSGKITTVKIFPELAKQGRYFKFNSKLIDASINFVEETPLCTTLCKDGYRIRTVEHLLSALEGMGVDNCRVEIESSEDNDGNKAAEVPILDGSAREWVEAINQVGLKAAIDQGGSCYEKMAPYLKEPVHVWKNDSFMAAFPSPKVQITSGIDFHQVPAIGHQWISSAPFDDASYSKDIASSRTFCIFEEVEQMRNAGLIKGGSIENAIICSAAKGWLNPPLRFDDEPCRHKVLDIIGDISLFARHGSQGLPMAHLIAYKSGHALHADFVRRLLQIR